jgi:hypothetical protein
MRHLIWRKYLIAPQKGVLYGAITWLPEGVSVEDLSETLEKKAAAPYFTAPGTTRRAGRLTIEGRGWGSR